MDNKVDDYTQGFFIRGMTEREFMCQGIKGEDDLAALRIELKSQHRDPITTIKIAKKDWL